MARGKMYHIVVLNKYTPDAYEDATEEPTYTFVPIAETVHAERIYLNGFERFLSDQTKAGEQIKLKIDHRTDIDEKDTVTHEGRDYNIKAMEPVGRDRYLILRCSLVDKENQINP